MAKLSKDLLPEAIGIIREYVTSEVMSDAKLLAQSINDNFDVDNITEEDVKDFVVPYNFDSIDRYLTIKNIFG